MKKRGFGIGGEEETGIWAEPSVDDLLATEFVRGRPDVAMFGLEVGDEESAETEDSVATALPLVESKRGAAIAAGETGDQGTRGDTTWLYLRMFPEAAAFPMAIEGTGSEES